ncbi:hypothetical protein PENSPDRAFT_553082, partial [Peniophora sp. CONT]
KGTTVQQKMWQPTQPGDVIRHVRDATLLVPIFFIRPDHIIGIDVSQVLSVRSGALLHILDSNAPVSMGGWNTTHLTLKWPGYSQEFRKQIELRDHREAPITMSKLAERAAKFVERFIEEAANWQISQDAHYWRVGPHHITKDHLYIVGLVHVSAGSWQPSMSS